MSECFRCGDGCRRGGLAGGAFVAAAGWSAGLPTAGQPADREPVVTSLEATLL